MSPANLPYRQQSVPQSYGVCSGSVLPPRIPNPNKVGRGRDTNGFFRKLVCEFTDELQNLNTEYTKSELKSQHTSSY